MWKRSVCVVFGLVILSAIPALPLSDYDRQQPGHYLNMFLIEVDNEDTAVRVARENGFEFIEKVPQLDMYLLNHPSVSGRSKRSSDDYVDKLKRDNRVKLVEQQVTLQRVKRTHEVLHDKQVEFPIEKIEDNSKYYRVLDKFDNRDIGTPLFNDKYFADQWSLLNVEQTGGKRGIDLNIVPAWREGFTGEGVVVTTLDDGIYHEHPDLKNNYDPDASADFNDRSDKENDPTPDEHSDSDSHGTRCAGEIAAEADNGICGVGVAYKSRIGGIRILAGQITDELEARALLYNNQHIDIFSASWGPHDDGATMEGPKAACKAALRKGVEHGRGGKGSIYVWAAGNGGMYDDMCGADGYVSSPESISVQSLTDKGDVPFFGEKCTSTMISVPTGGEHTKEEELGAKYKIKVVTTDLHGECIENFEGTSSAAPLASGVYALVLQANPELGWRDVQHITAETARISLDDSMWTINGAGFHVNNKFGFGMMDATRMVELAQNWVNKPEQHICGTELQEVNRKIESSGCYKTTFKFDGCESDADRRISHLEHVELYLNAASGRRGNVEIFIESPAGTRSALLTRRDPDDTDKEIDFTFMTVHSWMENPNGEWTLEVCDNPGGNTSSQNTIHLKSWKIKAYGYHDDQFPNKGQRAQKADKQTVEAIMKKEISLSKSANLKRAQPNKKNLRNKQTHRNAKYFNGKLLSSDTNLETRDFNLKHVDNEKHYDSVNREINKLLTDLENRDTSIKSYVEKYLEYKRKQEQKREMMQLISELNELVDKELERRNKT